MSQKLSLEIWLSTLVFASSFQVVINCIVIDSNTKWKFILQLYGDIVSNHTWDMSDGKPGDAAAVDISVIIKHFANWDVPNVITDNVSLQTQNENSLCDWNNHNAIDLYLKSASEN